MYQYFQIHKTRIYSLNLLIKDNNILPVSVRPGQSQGKIIGFRSVKIISLINIQYPCTGDMVLLYDVQTSCSVEEIIQVDFPSVVQSTSL